MIHDVIQDLPEGIVDKSSLSYININFTKTSHLTILS